MVLSYGSLVCDLKTHTSNYRDFGIIKIEKEEKKKVRNLTNCQQQLNYFLTTYCREKMKNGVSNQGSNSQTEKHSQDVIKGSQADGVSEGDEEDGGDGAQTDNKDRQCSVTIS